MSILKYISALPAVHLPVAVNTAANKAKALEMRVINAEVKAQKAVADSLAKVEKGKIIQNILNGGPPIARIEYATFNSVPHSSNPAGLTSFANLASTLTSAITKIQSSVGNLSSTSASAATSQLTSLQGAVNSFKAQNTALQGASTTSLSNVINMNKNLQTISGSNIASSLQNVPGLSAGDVAAFKDTLSSASSVAKSFSSITSQLKALKFSPQYTRLPLLKMPKLPKFPKIPSLPKIPGID